MVVSWALAEAGGLACLVAALLYDDRTIAIVGTAAAVMVLLSGRVVREGR